MAKTFLPKSIIQWVAFAAILAILNACGGGGGSHPAPNTPTPTPQPDITPENFSFEAKPDVGLSQWVESDPVVIAGIDDKASISISGGEYAIDDSVDFIDEARTITVGQTVRVRVMSAATMATASQATLTVGTSEASFTATTFLDTQAPVVEIDFPPPVSLTANTTLTVRGTVSDDYSDVIEMAILINGTDSGISITPTEDEHNPGVYNWSAQINLTEETDHTVIVSTTDSAGNIDNATASVMVTQGSLDNAFPNPENPYGGISSATLDFRNGQRRLLTVQGAWSQDPLLTVTDLNTGERIEQIQLAGLPQDRKNPHIIEFDKETGFLYALTINKTAESVNVFSIAAIDPANGELATNPISSMPIQPFILPDDTDSFLVGGMTIDRSGVLPRLLLSSAGENLIYQIDLNLDGNSFGVFSNSGELNKPWELLYHEQDQRLFVTVSDEVNEDVNILELNLNNGQTEPFSMEGDGESQHGITGMESTGDVKAAAFDYREDVEQIILSGLQSNRLALVDLSTGFRAPFSYREELMNFTGVSEILTHPALGYVLVTDAGLDAVFAVDLESGERVIISKSNSGE